MVAEQMIIGQGLPVLYLSGDTIKGCQPNMNMRLILAIFLSHKFELLCFKQAVTQIKHSGNYFTMYFYIVRKLFSGQSVIIAKPFPHTLNACCSFSQREMWSTSKLRLSRGNIRKENLFRTSWFYFNNKDNFALLQL